MATRAAKAEMDAIATRRIDTAIQTLQERFGLDPVPARPIVRDPEHARIEQNEDFATVLEGIVNASEPEDPATVLDRLVAALAEDDKAALIARLTAQDPADSAGGDDKDKTKNKGGK